MPAEHGGTESASADNYLILANAVIRAALALLVRTCAHGLLRRLPILCAQPLMARRWAALEGATDSPAQVSWATSPCLLRSTCPNCFECPPLG
jgi:hypothetical protein